VSRKKNWQKILRIQILVLSLPEPKSTDYSHSIMDKEIIEINESEYNEILSCAIAAIENARFKIAKHICANINSSYWEIGKLLLEKKIESEHGSSVVKRLSADLKQRFPKIGMSTRQLWNMKSFYSRYYDRDSKLLQAVAVLPWSHNLLILNKHLSDEEILYYAEQSLKKGWSRNLLLNAIKMNMCERQKPEPIDNNFSTTLPAVQAMYANDVFQDSYNLGFLGVTEPILELEMERRLVEKIKLFLLELGKGFTFIGNQHVLEYNGITRKVDMLFFHRKLKCLVAIDLKIGEFRAEYAGQMNAYLSLLDRLERGEDENRSIGIILCAEKDHVEVELALEDMGKPIGVAEYQLIVPKEKLQQIISDEIKSYDKEISESFSNE
jgi:predicted nuclease of restriction endonuclease-like (RecB) superfamily